MKKFPIIASIGLFAFASSAKAEYVESKLLNSWIFVSQGQEPLRRDFRPKETDGSSEAVVIEKMSLRKEIIWETYGDRT